MLSSHYAVLITTLASFILGHNVDHTEFLQKYGYLPRGNNQLSMESLTEALKSMQRMAGLDETGVLDEPTKRMMARPRCGHPDVEEDEKLTRGKRYAEPQFKWNDRIITYGCKAVGTSTRISLENLRRAMHQAATQWSELADIEIVRTSAKSPMMQISAGSYTHYPCTSRFDSRTLAHAFFPPNGQIHINDNVQFAMTNFTESYGGNSLYSVVAHEMGHALGFGHSPEVNSVMFAYDYPRRWEFTAMDKYKMRAYYGTKKPKDNDEGNGRISEETEREGRKEGHREREGQRDHERDDIRPNECRVQNPIVVQYRSEFLVFKSQWVWRVSSDWNRLILKAVPIDQMFPGLPNPIDAAVTVGSHLWVFVGEKIYVIYGSRIMHAPLTLSQIGINEKHIDLAYEWHYFNPPAIYIWKGSKYWKLDEKMGHQRVDERYPKYIELNWARVPMGVSSAFTYQKEIHFLRGNQVFRMNSSRAVFDIADGYPQPLQSFFGFCPRNEMLISNDSQSSLSFSYLLTPLILCFISEISETVFKAHSLVNILKWV